MSDDLCSWSARRIAAAVAAREVSARAVVDAYLARIDARNGELNAVIARCDDRARAEADRVDRAVRDGGPAGVLAGVPITVKDMHATAGLRTTFGLPWYRTHVPDRDSVAVARLRAAGAIVLGKSNLPFAGYDWQTRHPIAGVTRNPHDPRRTCGGSSGGAAAALAAGFCALELGADLAGSIRVPAHFCGVFGLKTSAGAVSLDGHGPPEARVEHMCVVGPLARTLEDLELAFEVVAEERTNGPARDAGTPLRVAWTDALCGVRADAATRRVIEATVARLRDAGLVVERAVPPGWDGFEPLAIWAGVDGYEFRRSWPRVFQSALTRQVFRVGIVAAGIGPSRFSRAIARGMAGSRRRWEGWCERHAEFAAASREWFASHDVLLAPCAATAAFTHRRVRSPLHVDDARVPYSLAQSAFCCPANASGACALVTPAGRTDGGLPIGVQWIAAPGRDRELIARVRSLGQAIGTSLDGRPGPLIDRAPR